MTDLPIRTPNTLYLGQVNDAVLLVDGVATQRVGAAIQITADDAGEVTLTLYSGAEVIITVGIGDSIYPYQVSKYTSGTATITRAYNLFI